MLSGVHTLALLRPLLSPSCSAWETSPSGGIHGLRPGLREAQAVFCILHMHACAHTHTYSPVHRHTQWTQFMHIHMYSAHTCTIHTKHVHMQTHTMYTMHAHTCTCANTRRLPLWVCVGSFRAGLCPLPVLVHGAQLTVPAALLGCPPCRRLTVPTGLAGQRAQWHIMKDGSSGGGRAEG